MAVEGVGVADAIRLARLRVKPRLSARALSAAAGLSPSYVTKLEAGEIEPSLKAFARLARVLKMTPTEIWLCVVSESSR